MLRIAACYYALPPMFKAACTLLELLERHPLRQPPATTSTQRYPPSANPHFNHAYPSLRIPTPPTYPLPPNRFFKFSVLLMLSTTSFPSRFLPHKFTAEPMLCINPWELSDAGLSTTGAADGDGDLLIVTACGGAVAGGPAAAAAAAAVVGEYAGVGDGDRAPRFPSAAAALPVA